MGREKLKKVNTSNNIEMGKEVNKLFESTNTFKEEPAELILNKPAKKVKKPVEVKELKKKSEELPVIKPAKKRTVDSFEAAKTAVREAYGIIGEAEHSALSADTYERRKKHHLAALDESDIKKRAEEAMRRQTLAAGLEEYDSRQEGKEFVIEDLDREEFHKELRDFMEGADEPYSLDTDEKFAANYEKNYQLCEKALKLKKWVSDAVEGDYMPEDAELAVIETRIQGFLALKDFLDVKKSLMTNPYYSYLSDKDVKYSDDQLNKIIKTTGNESLKAYLKDLKTLKDLDFVQKKGMSSVKKRAELLGKRQAELLETRAEKSVLSDRLSDNALSFKASFGFGLKDYDAKFTPEKFRSFLAEFGAIDLKEIRMGDVADMTENFRNNALLFEKARRMEHLLFLAKKNNVGFGGELPESTLRALSAKIQVFKACEKLMYGIQRYVLKNRDKAVNEQTYAEIVAEVRTSLGKEKGEYDIAIPELGANFEKFYQDVLKSFKDTKRENRITEDYIADTKAYAEKTLETRFDAFIAAYEKRYGEVPAELKEGSLIKYYLLGASSDRIKEAVRILNAAKKEGEAGEEGRRQKDILIKEALREFGETRYKERNANAPAAEDQDLAYSLRLRKMEAFLSEEEKEEGVRLFLEKQENERAEAKRLEEANRDKESVLKGVRLSETRYDFRKATDILSDYSPVYKEEKLSVTERQKLLQDQTSELGKKYLAAQTLMGKYKDGANKFILARRGISIENRIKAGDETLEVLCAFMTGNKEADNELAAQYADQQTRNAVLDRITREFAQYPVNADLSNKESIVRNADKLEEMTRKAYAFRALLKANPEYAGKLKAGRGIDGEKGKDMELIEKKLGTMLLISDYYRAAKLLYNAPYYILHKDRELGRSFGKNMTAEQRNAGNLTVFLTRCATRLENAAFSDREEDGVEEELKRLEARALGRAFVTGRVDIEKADVANAVKEMDEIREYIDAAGLNKTTAALLDAAKTDDKVPYPQAECKKTEAAANYIEAHRNWARLQSGFMDSDKVFGKRNMEYEKKIHAMLKTPVGKLTTRFSYKDPRTGELFKLSTDIHRISHFLLHYGEDLPEEEIIEIFEGLTLQSIGHLNSDDEATQEYAKDRWLKSMQKLFYLEYNYALRNENTIGTVRNAMPMGCFMQSLGSGIKDIMLRNQFSQDVANMVDDTSNSDMVSEVDGKAMTAGKLLLKFGLIKQEEYDHLYSTVVEYYQNQQATDNDYYRHPYKNFGDADPDPYEYTMEYGNLAIHNLTENHVRMGGPKLSHAKQRELWKKALESGDINLTGSEENVEFQKHRLNLYTKSERKALIKQRRTDQSLYVLYNYHLDERTETLLKRTKDALGVRVTDELLKPLMSFHPGLLQEDKAGQVDGEEGFYNRVRKFLGIGIPEGEQEKARQEAFGELIEAWKDDYAYVEADVTDSVLRDNDVREHKNDVIVSSKLLKNEVAHRRFLALQDMAGELHGEGLLTEEHQQSFRSNLRRYMRYEVSRTIITGKRYAELRDAGDRHSTVPEKMYDELLRIYYRTRLSDNLPVDGNFLTDREYKVFEYYGIRVDRPFDIAKKEPVSYLKTRRGKKEREEENERLENHLLRNALNTLTIERQEEVLQKLAFNTATLQQNAMNTVTIERVNEPTTFTKNTRVKKEEPLLQRAFNTATIERVTEPVSFAKTTRVKKEEPKVVTTREINDYNSRVKKLFGDTLKRFEKNIGRNPEGYAQKHSMAADKEEAVNLTILSHFPEEGESEAAFKTFNTLSMDPDLMDSADKKAFTAEAEKIFAKVLDFDLKELEFSSIDELGSQSKMNARIFTMTADSAGELVRTYAKLMKDKKAGCLLGEEQIREVRTKILTIAKFKNWFDGVARSLFMIKTMKVDFDKAMKGEAEGQDKWSENRVDDIRSMDVLFLVLRTTILNGYEKPGAPVAPVYEALCKAQNAKGAEAAKEISQLLKEQNENKLKEAYEKQKKTISYVPRDIPVYEGDGSFDHITDKRMAAFEKKRKEAVARLDKEGLGEAHKASGSLLAEMAKLSAKQKSEKTRMFEKTFKVLLEFDLKKLEFDSLNALFDGGRAEVSVITKAMGDLKPEMLEAYESLMKEQGVKCALGEEQFAEVKAKWEFLHDNAGWFNELTGLMAVAKKHNIDIISLIGRGDEALELMESTKDKELKDFYGKLGAIVRSARESGFGPGVDPVKAHRKIRAKYGLGLVNVSDEAVYSIRLREAEEARGSKKKQAPVLHPALERELKEIDELYKKSGIPKEELQELKNNVTETFKYKRSIDNVLPEAEKIEGTTFVGIDKRDYHVLYRPVRMNSKGEFLTEQDRLNREANLRNHEGYRSGKLSDRKEHLDYVAQELMNLYMSPEQMASEEYIRSHKEQALRLVSFLHTAANRYTSHMNYYLTKADPKLRIFMFLLLDATQYGDFVSHRINYVLYGSGYGSAAIGGSTANSFYVAYKKGYKYKELKEVNRKLSEKFPGNCVPVTMVFNKYNASKQNPFGRAGRAEIRETLDEEDLMGYSNLSRTGRYLYEQQNGKPKEKSLHSRQVKSFIDKNLTEFFEKMNDQTYIDRMLAVINDCTKGRKVENENGIVDDLK